MLLVEKSDFSLQVYHSQGNGNFMPPLTSHGASHNTQALVCIVECCGTVDAKWVSPHLVKFTKLTCLIIEAKTLDISLEHWELSEVTYPGRWLW